MLNAIYEEDFLGFSYGFRAGRGTHDALDALVVGIESTKVNWILDADVRSFFDEISQQWLVRFLEHRIGDRRIIRLIQKWLKVGILEEGVVTVSERGAGAGAVISPLLANVYLHYVLDLWAGRWRRREATGDMIIVRYADDFIVGFQHEEDARRFLDTMRERLQEFALSLHPEKTRLIEFGRLAAENRKRRGLGKPETFTFLGFVFICSKTRRGKFQIKRKSRRDRMRVKLQAIKQELRRRMHQSIPEQGRWLKQVVTGYFNYHAVPTNGPTLTAFRFHVTNLWRRTLRRRSQKDWTTKERTARLANDWLPKPQIFTPGRTSALPSDTQGRSRMPELGPYGSVRGARGNSRPYRDPRLFLMDEPLSALDRMTKEEILPYFEALRASTTVPTLYVSHDISEIERLADHMVLLESGRLVSAGPLNDLLADPRLPLARSPEAATVLEARVGLYSAEDGLTALDIGGERLLMPRRLDKEGSAERVRITASDVSLAVDHPSQTTILNVLPVRVKDIHRLDNAQINVLVTIGHREEGPMLLARITRRAQRVLSFVPGQDGYAQIKAVSLIGSSS